MKKSIRNKWAKRLESGDYDQIVGGLHKKDGGYCCLGVLCEMAAEEGVVTVEYGPEMGNERYARYRCFAIEHDVNGGYLPEVVREWAGLEANNPIVTNEEGSERHLSSLNDNGVGFPEIAKLIRKHL